MDANTHTHTHTHTHTFSEETGSESKRGVRDARSSKGNRRTHTNGRDEEFREEDVKEQIKVGLGRQRRQMRRDFCAAAKGCNLRDPTLCLQDAWDIQSYEFEDTEHLNNLEALLIRLAPRQLFFPSNMPKSSMPTFSAMCAGTGRYNRGEGGRDDGKSSFIATSMPAHNFKASSFEASAVRLLESNSSAQVIRLGGELLKEASCGLFASLELGEKVETHGRHRMVISHLSEYVKVDAAAIRALDLLPIQKRRSTDAVTPSLLSVLNHCCTKMGSRMLETWIRQPLTNKEKIEERLNIVESLVDDSELRDTLCQEKLRGIPDVDVVIRVLKRKKCRLRDSGAFVCLRSAFQSCAWLLKRVSHTLVHLLRFGNRCLPNLCRTARPSSSATLTLRIKPLMWRRWGDQWPAHQPKS